MKKALLLLSAAFFALATFAQTPTIPFQGVARDTSGVLLQNQPLNLRVSIRDSIAAGPVVYQETDTTTTNALGLFTLAIGSGSSGSYSFASINWGHNPKYVQLELNTGGATYITLGTSQLGSVPYALYALNGGSNGTWNVTDTTVVQTDTTKYVGIGTTMPQYNLHAIGTIGLETPNETGGNALTIDQTSAMLLNQNTSTGIMNVFCTSGMSGSSLPGGSLGALGLDYNKAIVYGFWAISDSVQFIASDTAGNDGIVGSKDSIVFMDVSYNRGASLNSLTIDNSGAHWEYNNADQYTLPLTDGSDGQVVTTDGSGHLTFTDIPANTLNGHQLLSGIADSTNTNDTISIQMHKNNIYKPVVSVTSLVIHLPGSPSDGDTFILTFAAAVSSITYQGGTVGASVPTSATATLQKIFTYDSGTSKWY